MQFWGELGATQMDDGIDSYGQSRRKREVHEALTGSQKEDTSWVEACLHMNFQAVACANGIMRYICMG